MAVDMLRHVQSLVGGKFIYLECENNEKLIGFYIRNGFKVFGERSLDIDEQDFFGTCANSTLEIFMISIKLHSFKRGCNRMRFYRILVAVPLKYKKYQEN